MKISRSHHLPALFGAILILFLAPVRPTAAGSATWNLNPTNGEWIVAANWTPATVPNGPSDTATFAVSNTSPSIKDFIEVNSLVFAPGASAFTVVIDPDFNTGHSASLTLSGVGIVNNSGITQTISNLTSASSGDTVFIGSATAGAQMTFFNQGGSNEAFGGSTQFFDDSNAGSADFVNEGGEIGGSVEFFDNSSAADATFTCNGAEFSGDFGSFIFFHNSSTAANATFIANGGMTSDAGGAQINFLSGSPSAGNATLIANGGTDGGGGEKIFFNEASSGGTARVEVFGNGNLNVGVHDDPGITIGSLKGDGLVDLGSKILTTGKNNLDTTFAGVISGSGSLKKTGHGRLTLIGANTYTGRTQIKQGELFLDDRSSNFTNISGDVAVDRGVFGGAGIVAGMVVVGGRSSRPAVLEPNQLRGGNFIILKRLKFNSGSTCQIDVNSSGRIGFYSAVRARGVTIAPAAAFAIADFGNGIIPPSDLIVIDNFGTSAPIAGRFANLPEGGTIVVGNNTYVATYNGGDGNDLLLMVNH